MEKTKLRVPKCSKYMKKIVMAAMKSITAKVIKTDYGEHSKFARIKNKVWLIEF